MCVITVSRGAFSGGVSLAKTVAQRLGYRCIGCDVIVERAASHGVRQAELRAALERPPRVLDRFGSRREHFSHRRYVLLALLAEALAEEVCEGSAVYHGLAGHILLDGLPGLLRTRVVAPMDARILAAQERLKISRTEAIRRINKADSRRKAWTRFLNNANWGQASLFDLVLNLEYISRDEACGLIVAMARQRRLHLTEIHRQAIRDVVLARRVRARLALDPQTSAADVGVAACQGRVVINCNAPAAADFRHIQDLALALPGVLEVSLGSAAFSELAAS
jgi:cytidylate kinase